MKNTTDYMNWEKLLHGIAKQALRDDVEYVLEKLYTKAYRKYVDPALPTKEANKLRIKVRKAVNFKYKEQLEDLFAPDVYKQMKKYPDCNKKEMVESRNRVLKSIKLDLTDLL